MRTPLALLILALSLAGLSSAFGQQQERKLEERILKPNLELQYDLRQSSFGTNRGFTTKSGNVKGYGGVQPFQAKAFNSKSFYDSKEASFANSKYTTPQAPTKGKYELTEAAKQAETKPMDVKTARDADKMVDTRPLDQGNRSFLTKGRSQDRFDKEGVNRSAAPVGYTGSLQPMTINDVRELLNKNK